MICGIGENLCLIQLALKRQLSFSELIGKDILVFQPLHYLFSLQ